MSDGHALEWEGWQRGKSFSMGKGPFRGVAEVAWTVNGIFLANRGLSVARLILALTLDILFPPLHDTYQIPGEKCRLGGASP
jgi:hypothetical protein